MIDRAFFERPASAVAPLLIGARLLFEEVGGMIVETEAYEAQDAASHSFRGPTPRNRAMFGPAGHAYVYRSYGIHWCLNIVCEPGSAILLRALAPETGLETMAARRGDVAPALFCAGPGRLCQALGITIAEDGADMLSPPFTLVASDAVADVQTGPRIGISRDMDRPWRFGLRGSGLLSRRFPNSQPMAAAAGHDTGAD